jgi:hypothetical protein
MGRHDTDDSQHATADSLLKVQAVLWIMCDNCDRQKRGDLAAIVARGLGAHLDQKAEIQVRGVRVRPMLRTSFQRIGGSVQTGLVGNPSSASRVSITVNLP